MLNRQVSFQLLQANIQYFPQFYGAEQAFRYFQSLKQLAFQTEQIRLYGKLVTIPRLQAWYGELPYQYSGQRFEAHSLTEELLTIKADMEQLAHTQFNSVLANLYRNGQDSVAWHSDDEPELGKNPIIASVSFGAERAFQLKHKETGEKHQIWLKSGDVLLMFGETQRYWLHQIPKSKRVVAPRINITFRKIRAS